MQQIRFDFLAGVNGMDARRFLPREFPADLPLLVEVKAEYQKLAN